MTRQDRLVTFLRFCVRQEWLNDNSASRLSRVKVPPNPTDYFTRQEFEKLIEATRSSEKMLPCAGQLRILLLTLRFSGLRIGDAVRLDRSRLGEDDNLLLYQGKTGTAVYVPLPPEVASALRNLPTGNSPYFFWKGNSKLKSAVSNWESIFQRLVQIADIRKPDGTPKRCHFHMLRDTFAVEMLLAGVPLVQVSMLLGHKSKK